ncbi:multicopper oxidase domain-containing protein [Mesorhizobium sp. M0051]|uniref:multicopper oxidase domain-containing protein n=1 Tax=Mesorhizobium sp. M0051 TaxID=2956862 RepID=UPI00333C0B21
MHRRGFLAAGLATVLVSQRAIAQMKMDDMPGMDMGGHAGHDMGEAPQSTVVLPEGKVLRDLPRLANEAGTPGLFKAKLTAQRASVRFAEGLDTPILGYNGTSPGPLTFANRIPEETSTIHWHGMPVPADQDGNPMDPVATGADRTYSFDLPEGSAGSYWYHPHPHGRRPSKSIAALPARSSSNRKSIRSRPNMAIRCWSSPTFASPPTARCRTIR